MIAGVGVDVVAISRIARVLARFGDTFLARVLTPAERAQKHWQAPALARRWAIKEAVAKALGSGIGAQLSWQEIEVSYSAQGRPQVRLPQLENLRVHVTTSDDVMADTALAFCVLERD